LKDISFKLKQITMMVFFLGIGLQPSLADEWDCEIFPPEHKIIQDEKTGVKTVFITTDEADDVNLYFHQRSWLSDKSMVVFSSQRNQKSGIYGYLESTGEIVKLGTDQNHGFSGLTCARNSNHIYAIQGQSIVSLFIATTGLKKASETKVQIFKNTIITFPEDYVLSGSLNENSDGRFLSVIYYKNSQPDVRFIIAIEIQTGKVIPVATRDHIISHLQFSWTDNKLLMFARPYPGGDRMDPELPVESEPHYRIWHVNIVEKKPRPIFPQKPGELVTHECWWTGDRLTFCGGHHPGEQHVKIYDLKTKRISIGGAGSWWPGAKPEEITKRGWWHASGSPNGRWIAADTFHGDVVIFDARTTEEKPLSSGHRTYGKGGAHPHVGWAPSSDRVVYASNQRGNKDVVITYLPDGWK
jgi:hypothetical protein